MQEEAAWEALELMNRQQYLAGFNNFFDLSPTYPSCRHCA
jgi:hypothetical protein